MNSKEPSADVRAFIDRLTRLDAGQRAKLKRNAGKTLSESRGVIALFFGIVPAGVRYGIDAYFLVATLFPLADGAPSGDLGSSLRRLRTSQTGGGLDRRVERLLDADRDQLPFRLRQAVRYIGAAGGRIAWSQLLTDLLEWGRPSRAVQTRWARSYFASQPLFDDASPAAPTAN